MPPEGQGNVTDPGTVVSQLTSDLLPLSFGLLAVKWGWCCCLTGGCGLLPQSGFGLALPQIGVIRTPRETGYQGNRVTKDRYLTKPEEAEKEGAAGLGDKPQELSCPVSLLDPVTFDSESDFLLLQSGDALRIHPGSLGEPWELTTA
ncbi:hypothetical protein CB1_001111005 [Camelus ferus]|nr:hypothetical protein CB1_001111005 [Camelus ferus]